MKMGVPLDRYQGYYCPCMAKKAFRVRVQQGKLVGEAPAALAEGTELDLCLAEPDEQMTKEEAAALERALDAAWRSMEAGHVRPARDLIAELRTRS